MNIRIVATLASVALFSTGNVFAQASVDENLPAYEKTSGVSGNLSSIGSDTLANLMTLWAESFKRTYPNVNVQIQAAGSSTAPPALTENTSNLGPMSRLMKDKEVEEFEKKFGYKPTPIAVAIDALAVFVHKDNPVEGLTIPQIDAIFSSTRTCGYPQDIDTWGDLGLRIPGTAAKFNCMDATRYQARMVISRTRACVRVTLKTPSMNNRARLRSCSRSAHRSMVLVTRESVIRHRQSAPYLCPGTPARSL